MNPRKTKKNITSIRRRALNLSRHRAKPLIQSTALRKSFSAITTVLLACTFFGCSQGNEPTQSPVAQIPVDLVLHNGKVLTIDNNFSIQSAIAINDGKVVITGDESILAQYKASKIVDLNGKTLMPGFNDSHTHISGNPRRYIDLSNTTSILEMQSLVRDKANALGPGEWITGYGWSEDELTEQRKPTRYDLDDAAPNNPVVLTRAGAHSAVGSSMALAAAGITAQTPDPEGGVIEHEDSGEPNGIIRERHNLLLDLVPPSSEEEMIASLEVNLNQLLAKGITSITDAQKTPAEYQRWETLYAQAQLPLPRAALQFEWQDPDAIKALKERVGEGNDRLKIGPIKIFVDGGFTGPAAYTIEPYRNQVTYRGYLNMPESELVSQINEIHDKGWQMGIHAIGDAAIQLVVDTLADTLTRAPKTDHRHYLNHFSMRPPEATMKKMAEHNIHITQQANFTYTLEGRYAENLEGFRLAHNNPINSPMAHGIVVALSSDILPIGPMVGLYAAVTRKGMSGKVYGPDEAISIGKALRAYTQTGAFINFDENIKGTLEPGKYADMIVLSDDILNIDAEQILEVEVLQTYMNGELVFAKAPNSN
ncbi:amidohydrolase [Pseudomonadales bacterium]|nr:amidohydrolase [Pseudomonadales bacterium]